MTSIYIKPSKRKCSVSDFKCFDIFDENKKNIGMVDCDLIRIEGIKSQYHSINMEVVDGMIHIWSNFPLEFEPLINTLNIRIERNNKDEESRGKTIDNSKPTYEELRRQVLNLNCMLDELRTNNDALKYSLKMMYQEMIAWKKAAENWEQNYHEENDRANKLFEELNNENK